MAAASTREMPMRRHVAILLLVVAARPPLAAQQSPPARGGASGVVLSAEGRPLADAEVRAADGQVVRTGEDGRWQMRNLPAGRLRLEIRRIGFDRARRTALIPAGAVAQLADTLQYTGVRLEPVVVSGLRQALPGTFLRRERGLGQLALAADIEAIPTNLSDLDALYQRLPRLQSVFGHRGTVRSMCPYTQTLGGVPGAIVNGRFFNTGTIPLREWIRPYEIAAIEVVRGRAAWQLERDRLAAGDSSGPHIDRRIGQCEWVTIIWTKDFVSGRKT